MSQKEKQSIIDSYYREGQNAANSTGGLGELVKLPTSIEGMTLHVYNGFTVQNDWEAGTDQQDLGTSKLFL